MESLAEGSGGGCRESAAAPFDGAYSFKPRLDSATCGERADHARDDRSRVPDLRVRSGRGVRRDPGDNLRTVWSYAPHSTPMSSSKETVLCLPSRPKTALRSSTRTGARVSPSCSAMGGRCPQ